MIEVNQDPLGQAARRLVFGDDFEVWAKEMQDGSKAVGLFNRGFFDKSGTIRWSNLKIAGKWKVRDLWRQKDLGVHEDQISFEVPWHGCVLVRLWPAKMAD